MLSREPVRLSMTFLAAAVDPHLISALANGLFDILHFAYSVQGAGPEIVRKSVHLLGTTVSSVSIS